MTYAKYASRKSICSKVFLQRSWYTCTIFHKQTSSQGLKFSFVLISLHRISWPKTPLSSPISSLCSSVLCLINFFRFLPFSFTGNVGVENHPRFSTIAGEQLMNHNVNWESEQKISMLCTDLFLRHLSKEWCGLTVGNKFTIYQNVSGRNLREEYVIFPW